MTLPFWVVITYLFLMFVLAGVVVYMVFKMQLMGEVIEEQQGDIMRSSCVMETIREKIDTAVKVLGPLA